MEVIGRAAHTATVGQRRLPNSTINHISRHLTQNQGGLATRCSSTIASGRTISLRRGRSRSGVILHCSLGTTGQFNVGDVGNALLTQVGNHGILIVSLDAQVVLDFLHRLATISVGDQHATARGVGTPTLTTGDVPGIADHQLEVVIIVDRCRDVGVVLAELRRSDLAILLLGIEGVQELAQNRLHGALAGNHIRVLGGIVLGGDVVQLNNTALVGIQDLESLQDQVSAALVQVTTNGNDELIERDASRAVRIEVLEDKLDLGVGPAKGVLSNDLLELTELNGTTVVIISNTELAAKSSDTTGATVLKSSEERSRYVQKLCTHR